MTKLTEVSSHYEFGLNWKGFEAQISDAAVERAVADFARLLSAEEVAGKRVLDIGCGSGLHSLAALRLGAASVTAIDIDETSVETARRLLGRLAPGGPWTVEPCSVFDSGEMPDFDVVYSWGVLHHSGDMPRAVRLAAERVAPGGLLCLALYRKTPLCGLWRIEKRLYTAAPRWLRRGLEGAYIALFRLRFLVTGRRFRPYVERYRNNRGMDWMTDVRDWLGGYPYDSLSEAEMLQLAERLGLSPLRRFCQKPGLGLLGTGCDEYVFRRGPAM